MRICPVLKREYPAPGAAAPANFTEISGRIYRAFCYSTGRPIKCDIETEHFQAYFEV